MKIQTLLQKFGLTPKETALYLAALELGTASVQKIAEKSGLVRSTAYAVLEVLRSKGLVTTHLKKKVRYYSAEDPNHVLHFAESTIAALKTALPELQALAGQARRRPSVRFYEGKDGMQTILREILEDGKELIAFAAVDDTFQTLSNFRTFVLERIKKRTPIRVIMKDSPLARERKRLGPQELRQVRLIPDTHQFHGLIYIWKNKIAQFSFKNDYIAVVTESKELADMQRAMFESLWEKLAN